MATGSSGAGVLPRLEQRVGAILHRVALVLAMLGGALLCLIALITVVSIIGRALIPLGLRPVPGDFEIVELGGAVAIFAFLPWCQLNRGHVTVDLFVNLAPAGVQRLTTLLGDLAITAVAIVLGWRHWLGMHEMLANGQETYILGLPLWLGFTGGMAGAGLFALVSTYTAWRSLNALLSGQDPAPEAAR